MTFDEALAELGIEADADPDRARRAYLKLLKTRKPEVDPRGFMRLREAYDRVKPLLEMRASMMRAISPPPPEPAEEQSGSPEGVAGPAEAQNGSPEEENGPAEEQSGSPEEANGPPEEAARPAEAENGSPEEAARPAEAQNRPAAEQNGSREAENGPPEEPPVPLPSLEAIVAMMDGGLHVPAAHELGRLHEAAAHDATVQPPPVSSTLRLLLQLHAGGEVDAAHALHDRVATWMRASGQEARLLRGELAALWAVARDLHALPQGFPKKVRRIIARAANDGDLSAARTPLAAWQSERPERALDAALALRTHAPVIAAALAATLEGERARGSESGAPPARKPGGLSGWAIAAIIVALLRIIMAVGKSSTPSPSFDASRFRPPPFQAPQVSLDLDGGLGPLLARGRELGARQQAFEALSALRDHTLARLDAGPSAKLLHEMVGRHAGELMRALNIEDCGGARQALSKITARFGPPDGGRSRDEAGRAKARALEEAVTAYCKLHEASPALAPTKDP